MQRLAKRIANGDWEKHKRDKDIEPYFHVKKRVVGCRGINLQRTAYLVASSPTEKSCQDRTQPRTLRKNQDQAVIERKIRLVPVDEQHDRHSCRPVL